MYGVPDEFPSWAPVCFTLLGVLALGSGVWGLFHPASDPLPGQGRPMNVELCIFGGVWTVAGMIWWKKQNAPPY